MPADDEPWQPDVPPYLQPLDEPEADETPRRGRPRKAKSDAPPADEAPAAPTMDPEEAAARQQARVDLTSIKRQIHELTMGLLTAEPAKVQALTQRLQRLRVSMLMLREIVEDVADPTTHRELTLLQKMMDGMAQDPDEEEAKQRVAEQDARTRLANVGLDPETAGSMVRILQSLKQAMTPHDDPEPDDEYPESRPS